MSSAALLVDCHKIISIQFTIRIGWMIAKNWGKIGTTTSKLLKKNSKYYSKIETGPSTIPTFITTSLFISKVNIHSPRLQLSERCDFGWATLTNRLGSAEKHAFRLCQQNSERMDHFKEVHVREQLEFVESGEIHWTIIKVRFVKSRLYRPGQTKSVENFDNQLATLRRKIDFNNNTIFQQKGALVKEKMLLGV